MHVWRRMTCLAMGGALAGSGVYLGLVTRVAPVHLGVGRRMGALGPLSVVIDAPVEVVFDVLAEPYADRTSRAVQEKVRVLQRGQDLVLAAHYTPTRVRLRATTVETVHFQRPHQIDFRLLRGPVPHVVETFTLEPRDGHTLLSCTGDLGTDLWRLGQRWGDLVVPKWESVVDAAFKATKHEAERRHATRRPS